MKKVKDVEDHKANSKYKDDTKLFTFATSLLVPETSERPAATTFPSQVSACELLPGPIVPFTAPEEVSATTMHSLSPVDTIEKLIATSTCAKLWFETAIKGAVDKDRARNQAEIEEKIDAGVQSKLKSAVKSALKGQKKKHAHNITRLEGKLHEYKVSKKKFNKHEFDTAYQLLCKYRIKNEKNMDILFADRPLKLLKSQVIKLLSADDELGGEYQRLCVEALVTYKKELKKQYKDHLDDIELESRHWLRENASSLTGEKLEDYFFKILAAREFDPDLPEVDTNPLERLDPGNTSCKQDIEAELSEVQGDIMDLANINATIAQKEAARRESHTKQRQAANTAFGGSIASGTRRKFVHNANSDTSKPEEPHFSLSLPESQFSGRRITEIPLAPRAYHASHYDTPIIPSDPEHHSLRNSAKRDLPESTFKGPKHKTDEESVGLAAKNRRLF